MQKPTEKPLKNSPIPSSVEEFLRSFTTQVHLDMGLALVKLHNDETHS